MIHRIFAPATLVAGLLVLTSCGEKKPADPAGPTRSGALPAGEMSLPSGGGNPEALTAPTADWVAFGPIIGKNDVAGFAIETPIAGRYRAYSEAGGVKVDVVASASLFQLQHRLIDIAKSQPMNRDNCAKRGQVNLIPDIVAASLTGEGQGARLAVGADVDIWSCLDNPVREISCRIENRTCVSGLIRIECPTLICSDREGAPIKLNVGRERVSAAASFVPVVAMDGKSVTFEVRDVQSRPSGEISKAVDDLWKMFGGDGMVGLVGNELSRMAGEGSFTAALPDNLKQYDIVVTKAAFGQVDGNLVLNMELSGKLVLPPPDAATK